MIYIEIPSISRARVKNKEKLLKKRRQARGTALRFPHAYGAAPPPGKRATSSPSGWVVNTKRRTSLLLFAHHRGAQSRRWACAQEHQQPYASQSCFSGHAATSLLEQSWCQRGKQSASTRAIEYRCASLPGGAPQPPTGQQKRPAEGRFGFFGG